jgi:hypothetical protein
MANRIGSTSKPGEFKSPDLYFSAYLQTAGVELLRTDREANGRLFFVFDASVANLDELKTAWFNNTGKVSAQLYAHNIKSLKSVCHMG